jgi:outer membrane autotransporter protein
VTFNRMFRLGFAGGYSQSNFNSVNIPASGSADSYHFAVYGGWQEGPWALCGGGSVSWNDLNTSRQVTAVSLGGQQTSSYADKTWQGFVEGARNFAFGPAALEPFANLAYVHVGGDVSESGLAAMTSTVASVAAAAVTAPSAVLAICSLSPAAAAARRRGKAGVPASLGPPAALACLP